METEPEFEALQPTGEKILLVDDTSDNLYLLEKFLVPQGYTVFYAMSGKKALQLAEQLLPDLILLDVMMPGMDGFETCKRVKSHPGLRDIPVIFVTGRTEVKALAKAFEAGGVDYITKPVKRQEVVSRVRTHLQLQHLYRERERMIVALDEHKSRLQAVIDHIDEGIFTSDMDGVIESVNLQVSKLSGYPDRELIGQSFTRLLDRPFSQQYREDMGAVLQNDKSQEIVGLHRDGSTYPLAFFLRQIDVAKPLLVGVMRDITLEKQYQDNLQRLSETDSLTGVANRRKFENILKEKWGLAARKRHFLSIIMLDVDHFKRFNDSFGHPRGDRCLIMIAEAINRVVKRTPGMVARYGGEEFVVLAEGDPEQARKTGHRIIREVERLAIPHVPETGNDRVTVSLGIASLKPAFETKAGELLQRADSALYRAKQEGRNRLQVYQE